MGSSIFELIIELIFALGKFAFPVVVLVVILIFKKELSDLLKRIKRGKLFGQEFELTEKLDELSEKVVEEMKALPAPEDSGKVQIMARNHIVVSEDVKVIIEEADEKPMETLTAVIKQVEVELVNLISTYGLLNYFLKGFHFLKAVAILQNRGAISKNTAISLRSFYDLRNRMLHDSVESNKDDIMRLIDLGMLLSNAIKSVPREEYEVAFPKVDVFQDRDCRNIYKDVWGIILKVTSPGGKMVNERIYSTTKQNYAEGQVLSWEWNMEKTWGNAWYKHPESEEIKTAWSSSGEFVGRPLDVVRNFLLR